jgi:hypothetical protein
MKIFTGNDEVAVEIEWIGRKKENLVMWGKVLGTMGMNMYLTPEELCKNIKMVLTWRMFFYVLLLPYFIVKLYLKKLAKVVKKDT